MIADRSKPATRSGGRAVGALLAGIAAALLGGCGGEDEAQREITIAHPEVGHVDPAYAYTGDGLGPVVASEVISLLYTPLLTYRRAPGEGGAELIPGLAQDLPEVSADGRTYRLAVRDRLAYPNGLTVVASDFERAAKRVLLSGSAVARLLVGIEGAEEFADAGDPAAPIAGIATDDRTGEVEIELAAPDAGFSNVLAHWALGLVPRTIALRHRHDPAPPGIGPYEVAESVAGERLLLARSEAFPALDIPDIPTGNLDTITVEVGDGPDAQARAVLDGELDYMAASPPASVKSTLLSEAGDRYREHPAPATHLFALDAARPPFDDARVREAANLALDRRALARAFDGELEPGCSFLPPQVPGYDEDLDTAECPYGDPSAPPDTERARRLVERAGAEGAPVVVWGSDEERIAAAIEEYAGALAAIGLEAEARAVPHERYLRRLARGERGGEAAFLSVFLDFPHPLSAYGRIVAGAPGRTVATPQDAVTDRFVRAELARLGREPELDPVADRWAELDRYLVSPPQSLLAPIGHPSRSTFVSERLDVDRVRLHPAFGNDYTSFILADDPGR